MIRATVVTAIRDFLTAAYTGPVAIHPETGSEALAPPYAVIQIGSGEQLYPGQAEIWELNILIGVFHDSEVTSAATAEAQSAALFALFEDPDPLFAASAAGLAWTALERITTDRSLVEYRWQDVAGFRGIVAPVAED